jgi:hypothetical protein
MKSSRASDWASPRQSGLRVLKRRVSGSADEPAINALTQAGKQDYAPTLIPTAEPRLSSRQRSQLPVMSSQRAFPAI